MPTGIVEGLSEVYDWLNCFRDSLRFFRYCWMAIEKVKGIFKMAGLL